MIKKEQVLLPVFICRSIVEVKKTKNATFRGAAASSDKKTEMLDAFTTAPFHASD